MSTDVQAVTSARRRSASRIGRRIVKHWEYYLLVLIPMQVEIQNYVEENTVAFITGQRDLDTEWDSYVQGFEGLRLTHYLEVMQKTYDDFQ